MTDNLINSVVTVLTAIVGVAIIAVIVSKNANTAGVLSAGGSAFAQDLSAAVSPITGGSNLFGSLGGFNTTGFGAGSGLFSA